MAKHKNGICLISIPKSGTMFLSRYLEKLTAIPVVFGMEGLSESQLFSDLVQGWHPQIAAALNATSPSLETMSKRFAQMLARNRWTANDDAERLRIVSDHGLHNFLRFLINPSVAEVQSPAEVIEWAEQHRLAPVYLHRDIRSIANSLAHFLVSRRSFLVDIDTLSHAASLVSDLYAPVLAEQMRQWTKVAGDPRVLTVSYDELMKDPAERVRLICAHGHLDFNPSDLIETPDKYRSWTFRGNKTSWQETFSPEQRTKLASA